jgi:TetR/AcrR family transcriptional regulator, lmrAB and yxaGH operons repressor
MSVDTRTRMLESTARLLQQRGFFGTSLSEILEESGAPRGSLYFHFPGGKEQLVVEATEASVAEATEAMRQVIRETKKPGRWVRRIFEEMAVLMRESGYTFGCPVAPLVLDDPSGQERLAQICKAALGEWATLYEQTLREAGVAKQRAGTLALLILSALEGALLISRVGRSTDPLEQVGRELERSITAAIAGR